MKWEDLIRNEFDHLIIAIQNIESSKNTEKNKIMAVRNILKSSQKRLIAIAKERKE